MMTVHEVSRLTGVSIRALHHYDAIGILTPTEVTDAGYRLYDEAALERLQSILLFKELEFPLKEIGKILDSPGFDGKQALEQQIRLLEMKKDHLQDLIDLARGIRENGAGTMNFDAFDTTRMDEYARQAKETWGATREYAEFAEKDAGCSDAERKTAANEMMGIFAEFGRIRDGSPESPEATALTEKLQRFITDRFYRCSDEFFCSLADLYAAGGEFTENIDRAGGEGTALFASRAIHAAVEARTKA